MVLPHEHEGDLPEKDCKLHNDEGAGLPCFSRKVRESVRWHWANPGRRPRKRRWWCIACNYQNVQDREGFIQSWSWRNEQLGNGTHFRGIKDFAVNQFHWPRRVQFPPGELEAMAWPEADGDNIP